MAASPSMSASPLAVLLAAPLLGALTLALIPGCAKRNGLRALIAIAFSAISIVALAQTAPGHQLALPLIPSLGITLQYEADRLSLFFGALVSGIGALVLFYARGYFVNEPRSLRGFYATMLAFMGAMLGTVFAADLLTLFIAWELTGVCSFFLIGWDRAIWASRRGARMALLTTVGAGLGLFFSIFALDYLFGSFNFSELEELAAGEASPLFIAAFFTAFLAIAGKSALFPFHYWLPNAMAAPTPVSAYLHSATMVKLGVFLMARLSPIFAHLDVFSPTVTLFGFGTLLLGTLLALFAHDLKQIFAQTTVAQLGLLVGVYGLGGGALDLVHILNHSLYKAALFMVAGIVDHAAHTRDIRALGGIGRRAPLLASISAIALASFAGLPFTTGFLSKEIVLELSLGASPFALGTLFITAALNAFIAIRVFSRVFLGKEPLSIQKAFDPPTRAVQLSPLILVSAILLFGAAPGLLHSALSRIDSGLPALAAFHGFNIPLALSILALAVGSTLAVVLRRRDTPALPSPLDFALHFDRLIDGLPTLGASISQRLGFKSLSAPLLIVFGAIALALLGTAAANLGEIMSILGEIKPLPAIPEGYLRYPVAGLIALGAALGAILRPTLAKLIALSLAGFGIAVYYLLYRAPDLALTQLLVETATLLLILLVLRRMKRTSASIRERSPALRAIIAITIGAMMSLSILVFQRAETETALGDYYLAHSVALTEGQNAVNTVVVDFRGFDTLLEIVVLFIATLSSLGLLHQLVEREPALPRFRELSPLPRDLILEKIALYGIVPLQLFSVHLFFRGHNAPGGGFVAGLVTALSILLIGFAHGPERPFRYLRLSPRAIASIGLGLALFIALLPALRGAPILHHYHYSLGGFYLGSPLFFDLGVFLTVVGVIPALVFPLLRSVQGLTPFSRDERSSLSMRLSEPIDTLRPSGVPPREDEELDALPSAEEVSR